MQDIFKDRLDAGQQLADSLNLQSIDNCHEPIVLGIPRGGIATGLPIAMKYNVPLEPIIVRKLPLPLNDQMGFGVVTLDKQVILNDAVVQETMLDRDAISSIADDVYGEVLRRDREYRGSTPFPDLKGRCVIITDDGLATGYTMVGAVRFAREKGADKVIGAVPVAHREAYELVKKTVDILHCIRIDDSFSFAVAMFYEDFPDMSDEEVKELLDKARPKGRKRRHQAVHR